MLASEQLKRKTSDSTNEFKKLPRVGEQRLPIVQDVLEMIVPYVPAYQRLGKNSISKVNSQFRNANVLKVNIDDVINSCKTAIDALKVISDETIVYQCSWDQLLMLVARVPELKRKINDNPKMKAWLTESDDKLLAGEKQRENPSQWTIEHVIPFSSPSERTVVELLVKMKEKKLTDNELNILAAALQASDIDLMTRSSLGKVIFLKDMVDIYKLNIRTLMFLSTDEECFLKMQDDQKLIEKLAMEFDWQTCGYQDDDDDTTLAEDTKAILRLIAKNKELVSKLSLTKKLLVACVNPAFALELFRDPRSLLCDENGVPFELVGLVNTHPIFLSMLFSTPLLRDKFFEEYDVWLGVFASKFLGALHTIQHSDELYQDLIKKAKPDDDQLIDWRKIDLVLPLIIQEAKKMLNELNAQMKLKI